jgi:hypothetical protein
MKVLNSKNFERQDLGDSIDSLRGQLRVANEAHRHGVVSRRHSRKTNVLCQREMRDQEVPFQIVP